MYWLRSTTFTPLLQVSLRAWHSTKILPDITTLTSKTHLKVNVSKMELLVLTSPKSFPYFNKWRHSPPVAKAHTQTNKQKAGVIFDFSTSAVYFTLRLLLSYITNDITLNQITIVEKQLDELQSSSAFPSLLHVGPLWSITRRVTFLKC